MRGSFELRSQVFVMKALGEREPLKNSEYLSLCSNGFTFKWTNGRPFLENLISVRNHPLNFRNLSTNQSSQKFFNHVDQFDGTIKC